MEHHHWRYEKMYPCLWIYTAILFFTGLVWAGPRDVLSGLARIVLTEDALITDYILVSGPGPALVNSALVTAISILVLRASREPLNGMSLVVIGLMSGFSLFGKNPVNIWPILLGSWLYAKSRKEPFGKYAATGLMATALAPVVSYIALDNGWGTPPPGAGRSAHWLHYAAAFGLYLQGAKWYEPVQHRLCLWAGGLYPGSPHELHGGRSPPPTIGGRLAMTIFSPPCWPPCACC